MSSSYVVVFLDHFGQKFINFLDFFLREDPVFASFSAVVGVLAIPFVSACVLCNFTPSPESLF